MQTLALLCIAPDGLMSLDLQMEKEWRDWSFLRRLARVTKEMTPSHRLDLLTDAFHYAWWKSAGLDMQLLQRVKKAEKMSVLAAPVLVTERDMERWKKTELELAQQKPKPKSLGVMNRVWQIKQNLRNLC
ncbi:hypothetical protein MHYP_G00052260 [Metynnis hypsauchen]